MPELCALCVLEIQEQKAYPHVGSWGEPRLESQSRAVTMIHGTLLCGEHVSRILRDNDAAAIVWRRMTGMR